MRQEGKPDLTNTTGIATIGLTQLFGDTVDTRKKVCYRAKCKYAIGMPQGYPFAKKNKKKLSQGYGLIKSFCLLTHTTQVGQIHTSPSGRETRMCISKTGTTRVTCMCYNIHTNSCKHMHANTECIHRKYATGTLLPYGVLQIFCLLLCKSQVHTTNVPKENS